ncbi:sce7725 family protein [Staphylococcus simulans]|uniref:sce7725 family protein n=1 Tax=Staphylococcus simulans TaxID=1286 RepID=UPI000BBD2904|nr:sce7725 family protein [Staphylococcus simulans]ATF30452.1 hypothetical protein CO689_06065 [Staphylococcus simulans]
MYYPYLRGKQNELLALRELLEENKIGNHIQPIIEPVKYTTTFVNTLNNFKEANKKIHIVVNSNLTELKFSEEQTQKLKNAVTDENHEVYAKPVIIAENEIEQNDFEGILYDPASIILKQTDHVDLVNQLTETQTIDFLLASGERSIQRRLRGELKNKLGVIADVFNRLDRNSDYLEVEDEFFSDTHLYYDEDGYTSFSDYSVIGSNFVEGGFAPYAIAIHIVYFNDKKELRIKHFVSDSNEDISDPANKLKEALSKLVAWKQTISEENCSSALDEFERIYREERYPGLGMIKRLSIKHHLELMNYFMEERE